LCTLHKAPYSAVASSALFPRIYLVQNFFHSSLFSNSLTQYSSMWDIKFHAPVKQQVKLRILNFKFLDRKLEDKIFSIEG